jgi:GT2 family glycosyltransferase
MILSVVVPSYDDPAGLWFTHAASMVDLEQDFARDEFEFIAVIDGPENDTVVGFAQQGTCRILRGEFGGPQNSRRAGALAANGKYIVFLDSHVVPSRGMFRSLIDAAERTGGAIVHAPHCFWNSEPKCYAYRMDFQQRFWSFQVEAEPRSPEPYRIAVMGHGALLVNREKYFKIGGYSDLQRGWGGEEPYLNLKAWMLGESCWIDPRCYHWHYMTKRRTDKVYKQLPYVRNFMVAAYIIGGQQRLDAVYALHTFAANGQKTIEDAVAATQKEPYREAYEAIPAECAEERARVEAGPFGGDLGALVEWFNREGIPN